MSLGLAITLGIWFVGFVFFLLYWLGEEAKCEKPLSGVFVTFFALVWPAVLFTNIFHQMCLGTAKLGEKLYDKIHGEGKK